MVPWHLQPKYSGQSHSVAKSSKFDSAKAAAKRAKKAEKLKKKLEKREKNERDTSDSCVKVEEVREEEKSEAGDCLLGELLELCVDEMDEERSKDRQEAVSSTVKELNHEETEPLSQDHNCSACHGIAADIATSRSKIDTMGASKITIPNSPGISEGSEGKDSSKMPPETDKLAAQGYRTFQRYYHVFCCGELPKLFSQVEGVCVLDEFYDHENWCVLAERRNADTKHEIAK